MGPHLRWAYASDTKWDAFRSDILADENTQVVISDTMGQEKFGINTRWNVEGFGFIFITADNGGEFYELPPDGRTRSLNLSYEHRDLQDIIMLVERFEEFGRPIQLTEVGTSSGPSTRSVMDGSLGFGDEPYVWRQHWDQVLQADWMEGLYTLAYSNPQVEAVHWYDMLDGQAWIKNGGMLSDAKGATKAVYHRLEKLQKEWGRSS